MSDGVMPPNMRWKRFEHPVAFWFGADISADSTAHPQAGALPACGCAWRGDGRLVQLPSVDGLGGDAVRRCGFRAGAVHARASGCDAAAAGRSSI